MYIRVYEHTDNGELPHEFYSARSIESAVY